MAIASNAGSGLALGSGSGLGLALGHGHAYAAAAGSAVLGASLGILAVTLIVVGVISLAMHGAGTKVKTT